LTRGKTINSGRELVKKILLNYACLGNDPLRNPSTDPCKRHRSRPAITQYPVWLCYGFNLSHRDIEDLLAGRWIEATYESVRLW